MNHYILSMLLEQFPGNKLEKDNKWEIPGLLRLRIWLGLEKQEAEWRKMQTDGDLAVFAETVSLNCECATPLCNV